MNSCTNFVGFQLSFELDMPHDYKVNEETVIELCFQNTENKNDGVN